MSLITLTSVMLPANSDVPKIDLSRISSTVLHMSRFDAPVVTSMVATIVFLFSPSFIFLITLNSSHILLLESIHQDQWKLYDPLYSPFHTGIMEDWP